MPHPQLARDLGEDATAEQERAHLLPDVLHREVRVRPLLAGRAGEQQIYNQPAFLARDVKILQRQGLLESWHDRKITAGTEWAGAIDENLEKADVILLLVSADFLASDYCFDRELERAMERHDAGEARVIPIFIRPCDWSGAPFGKLQGLPKDARPVITWPIHDEAWTDVTKGIRRVLEEIGAQRAARER